MKLVRFGEKGAEKPGALDKDGVVRDLSAMTPDYAGAAVSVSALDKLRGLDLSDYPAVPEGTRLGSCVASMPNFHAVGLNYRKHAAETGNPEPDEPVLFSKATTALSGPFDNVRIPRDSTKLDWEVELGVVIGAPASYVAESDALNYVAGYCVINDVSERQFQIERTGQWVKGKSAPTFGPTGPWLVTADEVPDPQSLGLSLSLNGETMQSSNTSDMIFSVAEIVSFMSRFMDLVPGDVIATGTPEGVGMGQSPQRWLAAGDVMELQIDGLGSQRQEVVAFNA